MIIVRFMNACVVTVAATDATGDAARYSRDREHRAYEREREAGVRYRWYRTSTRKLTDDR